MMKTYDVIVIGGGFIGTAAAYHLAKKGASVLLLEARGLGTWFVRGLRRAVPGSEAHPGLHLDLVLQGLERLEGLEEELDYGFDWRRFGNIMLIRQENHWQYWTGQIAHLRGRGVPAEMLEPGALRRLRPACASTIIWALPGASKAWSTRSSSAGHTLVPPAVRALCCVPKCP